MLQQHASPNWYPAFEARYQTAANRIQNSNPNQQEKNRRLERLGELEAAEEDDIEKREPNSPPRIMRGNFSGGISELMRTVLMDPAFQTNCAAQLVVAAGVFLFRDGYPRIAGQGHNAHVYQVNGRVNGRYSIFQGRQTPVPGPDQILRPS